MLRTRFELATLEFEEERERATELLVLVLSGVLLALFALLFEKEIRDVSLRST